MVNNLIVHDIKINEKAIEELLKDCPDIIRSTITLSDETKVYYIFTDGLVDTEIMYRSIFLKFPQLRLSDFIDSISFFNSIKIYSIEDAINNALDGNFVFFVDSLDFAFSIPITKHPQRNITEPQVEKNLKGPHDGFVESLNINMALLRQKIKNKNLKFKTCTLGSISNQKVAIAYMEGIANKELLETLYNKVSQVSFDSLIGVGYIQQQVSDFKYSIFPTMQATERPDKVIASLMEGKLVILLESTPVTLISPVSFFSFFQALDDYNTTWLLGSFSRIMRFVAAILAVMLPPAYIALTSFHYYMIPLSLLIPFAESRSRVPFPPIIEALIMEVVIEFIRESAIRLPSYIGITIGVTGGIILGQATVQAGIVSNVFLIVIGVTALASYVTPSHDMAIAIRVLRITFMFFTALFGIVGIVICSCMTFARLLTLQSLDQPYLQPLAPFKFMDLKDTILRLPINFLTKRPDIAKPVTNDRGKKNG